MNGVDIRHRSVRIEAERPDAGQLNMPYLCTQLRQTGERISVGKRWGGVLHVPHVVGAVLQVGGKANKSINGRVQVPRISR